MENDLVVHSSSLIDRLESKPGMIDSTSPFYWYFHLKKLGKQAQTKEMVEEAVRGFSDDNHQSPILSVIAKKYLTHELCEIAVRKNGLNLKYVPQEYRNDAMCLAAVQSDGDALHEVPNQVLLGDKGYEICLTAVRNRFRGPILSLVPDCYLRGKEGQALCEAAVRTNGHALEDVPEHLISKELVASSVRLHPDSLQYAPAEFVSRDLCVEMIKRDPMNLQYVRLPDKELVECALQADPRAIMAVPASMLTLKLCRDALRRDPTIPLEKFPESVRKKLEREFRSDAGAFIKYVPIALETPASPNEGEQVISRLDKSHTYDLSVGNNPLKTIYYISDVHLEHQLVKKSNDIVKLSLPEIRDRIENMFVELLASVPEDDISSTLLIGGDVADCVELEALFYEQLTSYTEHHKPWERNIFAVLGNHELWDGDPMGTKPARPLDEIVAAYRQAMPRGVTLLENELFIEYKGLRSETLDEKTILNTSVEELAEVCANSTFLLLGGLGFSGLNPVFNADTGLYRATVSMEEDIARSKRFRAIYEKVLTSAKDIPVIVLTHTQMTDWSDAQYNPKWVYVSGHTHQNTIMLQSDGVAVFSDNQVGYKPQAWHLNSFSINARRYDPFKKYPNGIHQITREQYVEFNRCQGIMMQGMKHPGDLYAIKNDGVYMFVLESESSLCLLEGGKRHTLDYDISYYFEKLPEYVRRIRGAFAPYQRVLSMISDEVRAIGGSGHTHGCIVDIDWFNHIYLNPFDGSVTPYFAWNTTEKQVFKNVEALLETSPLPPQLSNGELMLSRYRDTPSKEENLPILSRTSGKMQALAVVQQVVLDRSMYEPSHIMRSIQYFFDQNVVRVWNDAILTSDQSGETQELNHEEWATIPADTVESRKALPTRTRDMSARPGLR